jgi:hypothetical protein
MSRTKVAAFAMMTSLVACDRAATSPSVIGPTAAAFGKSGPAVNPTANMYVSNDAAVLFQGDGLAAYIEPANSPFSGMSRYADGECGAQGTMFAQPGYSGDAVTYTSFSQDRKCAAFPRKARLTFQRINGDGSTTLDASETVVAIVNVHQIELAANNGNPGLFIPVGQTAFKGIHIADTNGFCYDNSSGQGLAFRPVLNDGVTYVGADDVQVHRDAADTWTITSQPDEIDPQTGLTIHHDKAYCRVNGQLYHMPVHFSVKSSAPLSP